MKKFLTFLPSVMVCAAVIYAIAGYSDSDTTAAIKKISGIKDALTAAESRATVSDAEIKSATKTANKITTGRKHSSSEKKNMPAVTAAPVKKSLAIQISATGSGSEAAYKDGIFTGSGTGFNGGTTVATVTIRNGKITAVRFTDQDTPQFFNKAVSVLRPAILSNGKQPVDTVSGATYSSNGIIESVSNALSKARTGAKASDNKSLITNKTTKKKKSSSSAKKSDKKKNTAKKAENLSLSVFVPGTYRASAICGPDPAMPLWDAYTISMSVTIASDGRITTTTPIGEKGYTYDDREYLEKAREGMIPLLTSQEFFDTNMSVITGSSINIASDVKVDTISGATYSSKAIKEAFVDALRQAVRHE